MFSPGAVAGPRLAGSRTRVPGLMNDESYTIWRTPPFCDKMKLYFGINSIKLIFRSYILVIISECGLLCTRPLEIILR